MTYNCYLKKTGRLKHQKLFLKFSLITLLLSFEFINAPAQDNIIERYRQLGYEARINGKTDSSVYYYSKITDLNINDYDANLALARLYFKKEDYEKSMNCYQRIFFSDSTDAEALIGFARIAVRKGNFIRAGSYYDKILKPKPAYIEYYFERANTLVYQDKLDSAIIIYKQILEIDQTYAEAWAGIGKMYYWQNQPVTATGYYKKALSFDSLNKDYLRVYENLKREAGWQSAYSFRSIMEKEESYRIDALVNSIGVNKRFSDKVLLSAGFLYDHSIKDIEWQPGDTLRIFTNFRLSAAFLGKKNNLTLFGGYSLSDKMLTSYGFHYSDAWRIGKKVKVRNTTALAYDYFYYWNQVGQDYISDNLMISINRLSFNVFARYGIIRKNKIADFEKQKYDDDINPYFNYNLTLRYKILEEPALNIGFSYSYLDYTYKSPLYYSPKNRNLAGLNLGYYQSVRQFYFYLAGGYNLGRESYFETNPKNPDKIIEHQLNVDNWSIETELGYHLKKFGFATGGSVFSNPYYDNRIIYITLNYLL